MLIYHITHKSRKRDTLSQRLPIYNYINISKILNTCIFCFISFFFFAGIVLCFQTLECLAGSKVSTYDDEDNVKIAPLSIILLSLSVCLFLYSRAKLFKRVPF